MASISAVSLVNVNAVQLYSHYLLGTVALIILQDYILILEAKHAVSVKVCTGTANTALYILILDEEYILPVHDILFCDLVLKLTVTGWLEETIYVTENSTVEISFGTVRGILARRTIFGVDIRNNSAS